MEGLTDPENLHRVERGLEPERGAEQDERQASRAGGQLEGQEILNVVEDGLALLNRMQDRREIIIRQNHVRRLLGDVGPVHAHCDANIRLLQRRRIVDPVARHGDNIAAGLQGSDDFHLVVRVRPRKDGRVVHGAREVLV